MVFDVPTRFIAGALEKILACKVYRNSLPRGTDLATDIKRFVKLDTIKTIFDVGANVGDTAVYYVKEFPEVIVHAFEPVETTFNTLVKRTKQFSRIHSYPLALGATPGDSEISVSQFSAACSMALDHGGTRQRVKCSTVDNEANERFVDTIDLLKIDVEGYEEEVLQGAGQMLGKHKIKLVYVESEPIASNAHFIPLSRLNEILSNYGYRLIGIYDQTSYGDMDHNGLYFNALYASPTITIKPQQH